MIALNGVMTGIELCVIVTLETQQKHLHKQIVIFTEHYPMSRIKKEL